MATRHSTAQPRIPAVAYLRRSTDRQEKSLADQRTEIERYAAEHGYQIPDSGWYTDDAISGDDTERRPDFLRMRDDAGKGKFRCVLCWDQDRFGRFDSIDAGHWIKPFRDAGVSLVTLNDGPIDWNDFTGRIMYSIKQEGKHQFLRDLSRNSARGHRTSAEQGFLCGQAAPYGYDRMLVDEQGTHRQRVHNGESVVKVRTWRVMLVPSDDSVKVKTVRWLFDKYANEDVGLRILAKTLNKQGVPGPRGGPWYGGAIQSILRNETYVGTFVYGKRRMGKYHCLNGTDIQARDRGDYKANKVAFNDESLWIKMPNRHEALVNRQTWERVQEKLKSRKLRRTPNAERNSGRYLLSGIVHCAHCGKTMHGTAKTKEKPGGKRYCWEKYICSTYNKHGLRKSDNASGCWHCSVDQGELLTFLLQKLREHFLVADSKALLRERIRARLLTDAREPAQERKELKRRLDELDKKYEANKAYLLNAAPELKAMLEPDLIQLKRQRDLLASELSQAERAGRPSNIDSEVDAATDLLWSLNHVAHKASPERLREVLNLLVERIELWCEPVTKGKRIVCPLSRGIIHFRPDLQLSRLVNRGDRI